MGSVIQLRRRIASAKTITKLVKLGYLPPARRHKPLVVEKAIARLRQSLYRDGVICDADLLNDQPSGANEKPGTAAATSDSSVTGRSILLDKDKIANRRVE